MEKNTNEHIAPDMFEFAQKDAFLHDEKFKTKARGYFADALLRFKKNKSSVVAASCPRYLECVSKVSRILITGSMPVSSPIARRLASCISLWLFSV